MTAVNAKVEAFYAKAGTWQAELAALREILLACDLTEEFKWRSPVYTFEGTNVAIVWGFKEACTLGFFKGVLLKDKAGILVAQGENSRSARVAKFTSVAEIRKAGKTVKAYVAEAIEIEKAGLKVDLPKDDLDYPAELVEALDGDAGLREAFESLTPGRQRGWVLHFSQAKQAETRVSRIAKARPRIMDGKGMNDR
tara:strand:- start:32 stop:619 length:588 start_codon:yes stop_codon:yes gene_type:complete